MQIPLPCCLVSTSCFSSENHMRYYKAMPTSSLTQRKNKRWSKIWCHDGYLWADMYMYVAGRRLACTSPFMHSKRVGIQHAGMELVGDRLGGHTHHTLAAACWTEISLAPVKDRGDGVCNLCTTSPLFKQAIPTDPRRRFRSRVLVTANENVCRYGCKCFC